jgi:hypothetical protein
MAARYTNNPRVTNRGDVERYFCLDVRRLVAEGILVKGERSRSMGSVDRPFKIYADLRHSGQAFMEVRYFDLEQKIELTWTRDKLNRSRVFFIDDTGRKAEKIYFVDGRFVSRQVGKLTFRSQSRGKVDGLIAQKTPLRAELDRDEIDRHLFDVEREKMTDRLKLLQDRLDDIGFAMVYDLDANTQRRRERRQASRERLRLVDEAMNQRATVSSAWILSTFTSIVDDLKSKIGKAVPPEWPNLPSHYFDFSAPVSYPDAEIDLDDLRRLKMLKEGEIHAREIGWPIKRLPQRRRKIYLIVDLRYPEKACATVIFHTPRKGRSQFFWLNKYAGMFGRDAYSFECPTTGRNAGRIHYGDRKFHLGSFGQRRYPRSKSIYPWAKRTPPNQPITPERVAFLRMLLKDEQRLGRTSFLFRWSRQAMAIE